MKEIAEQLKAARLAIALELEEAAEDLGTDVAHLKAIEAGKKDTFKDLLEFKEAIRSYAKYLSLDVDKIIDEFNEFMFDMTSRIPVEAIKQAAAEKKAPRIRSPYTMMKNKQNKLIPILVYLGIFILFIIILYLVITSLNTDPDLANIGGLYEFTN